MIGFIPSCISDINWLLRSCLRPFVVFLPTLYIIIWVFFFDFERTCIRLFQKRVMRTSFYIYVFMHTFKYVPTVHFTHDENFIKLEVVMSSISFTIKYIIPTISRKSRIHSPLRPSFNIVILTCRVFRRSLKSNGGIFFVRITSLLLILTGDCLVPPHSRQLGRNCHI